MGIGLGIGLGLYRPGGGGRFLPSHLGTDLIAWWTADLADTFTLSSAQVTTWRDVKAAYPAAQSVAGAKPLYSATSFNGAPGVTFDGTDDELSCTDAALLAALPSGSDPVEIWSVVQQDALVADTGGRFSCSYGANASSNSGRRTGRNVVTGVNRANMTYGIGASAPSLSDAVVDFSTRHLIRYVFTATGEKIAVDGNALSAETAAAGATTNNRLRLGAAATTTANGFWNGKIRDIVITGPLSAAQVTRMNAWGLARRVL